MNETVRPRTRGELLDAWRRHLTLQRGLSEHTARAYVGDVGDLLSFLGVGDDGTEPVGPALASLDLADLRDWLARMSTSGRARATIARRAAAAKAFSTWAHRLALLPADAAARLRSPRADNRLPAVWAEAKQQVMTLRDQTHAAEIPDLVIGPQPGDAHQDHRLVAELLGQAFRQQPLWGYEIVKYESDLPQVTGYVPFQRAEALAKSELLHRYYPSQVAHPWFDEEAFLGLMRVRGCQCLAPYAEGFVVTKTIVEIGGHR